MMSRPRLDFCHAAGPRLRCFLGRTAVAGLLGLAVCLPTYAQLEVSGPIHLTSVEGLVVDSFGKPAANVAIMLSRDGKVLSTTHSDQAGAFHFDRASGEYLFQVARSANSPAAQQIIVRMELATLVQRKKLYVILGPGACTDACSSVFTSKQDFDKALRKLNRH